MKIWHLISNRWNSAISEYALSAARATSALGADVLVSPLLGSPIEKRFLSANCRLSSVENFGPGQFSRIAAINDKFKPDVIFTYGGPETTAAFFFKGKAKLIRFHGYKTDPKGAIGSAARKLGHIHVDAVLVPSEFIADGLRDAFSCPVEVVTLGCDTELFNFRDISRSPRPELLIFGRLDPVKGHREFFTLFKKMLRLSEEKGSPRPKLRIVGVPANLSVRHVMESAQQLGVSPEDFDIQADRISNVSDLMSKVSLGVVSSLGSEAICRVAEEFLLCGTPVVTTDVGSLKEVFIRETFGACYGRNDSANAPEIISTVLLSSFGETTSDRRARAEEAKRHFSIEAMSEHLKRLI